MSATTTTFEDAAAVCRSNGYRLHKDRDGFLSVCKPGLDDDGIEVEVPEHAVEVVEEMERQLHDAAQEAWTPEAEAAWVARVRWSDSEDPCSYMD